MGAIRKRRICGRYCYVTMLCVELSGCSCGGEGDGDEVNESADGTVMLPCYVWSCRGAAAAGRETETKLPCYLQLLGVDVGERDCGDESADAAVGGRCGGARLRRRICGRCCSHAICGCWG